MMMIDKLIKEGLINPPKWLPDNTIYLTRFGSAAYGVQQDDSDQDIYGVCIPPKPYIFPHTAGIINGFGNNPYRFDQWSQHHIKYDNKEFDFTVYNIVKYFQLVMENNPNMLDSLFVPRICVIHSTAISEHIRENRKLFLTKQGAIKTKAYAYSQLTKMLNKKNSGNEKRNADIEKYGYSTKFAYHLVRLLNQSEQILVEHDLDLLRNREQLKSIRRGEWELEQIISYFNEKERVLEGLYASSTLRAKPEEDKIKKILMECLEMHYGSIDIAVNEDGKTGMILFELERILEKYKS